MATTPADSEAPIGPETVTQEQILGVFVDRQPRPTTLIAERLDADPTLVENTLYDMKGRGVVGNHERSDAPTLWFVTRQNSRL